MAAQLLFSSTMWSNAYFADMERVETGVECAFQFMAAFAVPAETSDTCALMAYLSRWSGYAMGLIVHLPPEMTPRLLKHISHNVEKLCKASSLLVCARCVGLCSGNTFLKQCRAPAQSVVNQIIHGIMLLEHARY